MKKTTIEMSDEDYSECVRAVGEKMASDGKEYKVSDLIGLLVKGWCKSAREKRIANNTETSSDESNGVEDIKKDNGNS